MNEIKERVMERLKQLDSGSEAHAANNANSFEARREELSWVLQTIEEVEASHHNEAWGDY